MNQTPNLDQDGLRPNGCHTDEDNPVCVAWHKSRLASYLYVYAGPDPDNPSFGLEMATAATPGQVRLWQQGRTIKLIRLLVEDGFLSSKIAQHWTNKNGRPWTKRLLDFLRRFAPRG